MPGTGNATSIVRRDAEAFVTIATVAGRKLDQWELAGAKLVAQMLGGRPDPQDVERAPDATHDFNIVGLANGRVVALEITSAFDPAIVSQNKAAFGKEWSTPTLANNWIIGIGHSSGQAPALMRKVMPRMVPILALFERNGETSVDVLYSPRCWPTTGRTQEMHEAMVQMFDLRVEAVRMWTKPELGRQAAIYPTINAGFGSNPAKLNELVVKRAERKAKKLLAATADERHLFVWLDSTYEDAELAFKTLPPPPPPTIPVGIDVVWLVGLSGGPDAVRIWRLAPPGGWDVLASPIGYVLEL
jgi:hypothetical protein